MVVEDERRRRLEEVENRFSSEGKVITKTTATHDRRPLGATPQATMRTTNTATSTSTSTTINKTPIMRRGGLPRREDMLTGTADGFSTPRMPPRRQPPSTTRGAAVAMTTNTTTDTAATIGVGGVVIETTPRTAINGDVPQQHTKIANHADENKRAHVVDPALLECELKSRTEDGAAAFATRPDSD